MSDLECRTFEGCIEVELLLIVRREVQVTQCVCPSLSRNVAISRRESTMLIDLDPISKRDEINISTASGCEMVSVVQWQSVHHGIHR
jgi:hypothetical protein